MAQLQVGPLAAIFQGSSHRLRRHRLVRTLKKLGYRLQTGTGWGRGDGHLFDLFKGNFVYTTGLLESPLDNGNNTPARSLKKIYVGVLNDYDLITTKMFRGTDVDFDDCLANSRESAGIAGPIVRRLS